MLVRYLPTDSDAPVETDVGSTEALNEVLAAVWSHGSDRGVPAIEMVSEEGSTLVVGQTLLGAVLLWIDSCGNSFHSVGPAGSGEGTVVFDYFGSYTEVPTECVVPLDLGRAAAFAFLVGEHPGGEDLGYGG